MAEPWPDRIAWIVDEFAGGSQRKAAQHTSIKSQAISNWVRGENVPAAEALAELLAKYPRINPDWLLTGKGPRTRDYRPPATPTDAQRALEEIAAIVERTVRVEHPVRTEAAREVARRDLRERAAGERDEAAGGK